MSYSGDAAEQVVRMSLETGEVAVRLAGSGAKQLAVLIYAILREQKKTAGKACLTNMLRSGKELKVFGESHVAQIAAKHGLPVLGRLPIDPAVAAACDAGEIGQVSTESLRPAVDAVLGL